jgi:mono/diheme cytochrome c family protein
MNYNADQMKNDTTKTYYLLMMLLTFVFTSCETSSLSELSAEEDGTTIDIVTYENRAQEILNNACVECHNANQQNGDVRLDAYEFAFLEADSGRMLSRMTNTTNPMPPSGNLPDNLIEDIMNWVDNGILEN